MSLFRGLIALSIIVLLSYPVFFEDPLSSLYMIRPFLQKRQTSGQSQVELPSELLFDNRELFCSPDDLPARISVNFL